MHVARNREPGVTIAKIARDFGVHPMTLTKWMRRVYIDDGSKPGMTSEQSAQLRQANRRIRLLEQENEVLRRGRSVSVAGEPAGK